MQYHHRLKVNTVELHAFEDFFHILNRFLCLRRTADPSPDLCTEIIEVFIANRVHQGLGIDLSQNNRILVLCHGNLRQTC